MLVIAAMHATADAQPPVETIRFDLPAQDLELALKRFGVATDRQLMFATNIAEGKTANSLSGEMELTRALDVLLEGTGLVYETTSSNVILVKEQQEEVAEEPGNARFAPIPVLMAQNRTTNPTSGDGSSGGDDRMSIDEERLEEIVVTALKRSSALQDTALSIRAFSKQMLTDRGATRFADFLHGVPSVSYQEKGPGRSDFVIRGVSPVSGVATVGMYIEDMPATDSRYQPEISMYDIERVEILRGPQGTLYGEGAVGGIIRVVTSKPDSSKFEGLVEGSLSATHNGGINKVAGGVLNLPVKEGVLALRLSSYLDDTSGWIDNVAPGLEEQEVNAQRLAGGKFQALWNIGEPLTVSVMHLTQSIDLDGLSYTSPEAGDLEQAVYVDEFAEDQIDQSNLTVNYDLPRVSFTSSSSFLQREHSERNERSWLFLPAIVPSFGENDIETEVFSQEFRLASNWQGHVRWLAGLYAKSVRDHEIRRLSFDGPTGATIFDQTLDEDRDQRAIFGELSYDMTETLRATIGLRYFEEDIDLREFTAASPLFGIPANTETESGSFDQVTSKLVLSYRPSDGMLYYLSAAEGYRSGGFNVALQDPLLPDAYDPDTTWNYELGVKSSWQEGQVTINGALYYVDWSDMQILVRDPDTLIVYTDNAGKAESRGGEIEIAARPASGLELTLGGSYTDAELSETSLIAPAGTPLASVPKYTVNASAQYTSTLFGALGMTLRFDLTRVGESFFSVEEFQRERQGSYSTGNLSVGLDAEKWRATLFVDNLWDERADILVFPGNDRVNFGGETYRNRPRTVGLRLRWSF